MPRNKNKFQAFVEHRLVYAIFGVFRILPLRRSIAFGEALARTLHKRFPDLYRVAEINLRFALPDLTDTVREEILRGSFESIGRQVGFLSGLGRLSGEEAKSLFDIEGLEHFETAKADDRPVFLLSGHFGGWEVLVTVAPLFCGSANFIFRPPDNPRLEKFIYDIRSRFGTGLVGRRTGARQKMGQLLAAHENVIILLDVNWQERGGVFVEYFGRPASTAASMAEFVLEHNAAIIPTFAIWDKEKQRYLLRFEPELKFDLPGDREKDVIAITQTSTTAIERVVREFPDQWQWFHKRWNTRPAGEKGIY